MFRLLMHVPREIFVAVSGGPDSMAAVDFLRRSHKITALHFNHGTEHGKDAEPFVTSSMKQMGIPLITEHIDVRCQPGESKEAFWRTHRYDFFNKALGNNKLVMAHTLDDAMETWIFTSLHGEPRLIPAQRDYIIRPFLLSRKADMIKWCKDKNVPYINDPSNADISYPRVRIRRVILPELLRINPGLPKVVRKKYLKD